MLFQKIRTDRGLAYSTGSFYTAKEAYGLFGAYAMTKSESTAEVISLIRTIVREIKEIPVPLAELRKIKNAIVNSFIFSFTSADKIVFQQMMIDYDNLPDDYLVTYRDNIGKISVDDLRKAAARLDLGRAVILIVGNGAIIREIPGHETFRRIEIEYD